MKPIYKVLIIILVLCLIPSCNHSKKVNTLHADIPSYYGIEFEQERMLREYREHQKQLLNKTDDACYVDEQLDEEYQQLKGYYYANFFVDSLEPTSRFYSSGDFVFMDYEDGACLVQYNGSDENIKIPEMVNDKKVIAIGSYFEWFLCCMDNDNGKYIKESYDQPNCYSPFSYRECQQTTVINSIYIPKYVKYISQIAFNICGYYAWNYKTDVDTSKPINSPEKVLVAEENPYYISKDGALYTKDMKCLLYIPTWYNYSTFEVPKGVSTISKHCLKYGNYADELDFLNNEADFEGNVKKMIIPGTVTSIEDISILPKVEVSEQNPVYKSENGEIIKIK